MSNRKIYDGQLKDLSTELLKMAGQVVQALDSAMTALKNGDHNRAKQVIDGDEVIDHMERDMEQRCLKLLMMQQPVASDLRQVGAALKMITDIERIGDEAVDIAELSLHHDGSCTFPDLQEKVLEMAKTAEGMVTAAASSYLSNSLSLAQDTMLRDDEVDRCFNYLNRELSRHLVAHPDSVDEVTDYLMVVKYLERVGDHAVNLCEWVDFKVTGNHKKENMFS